MSFTLVDDALVERLESDSEERKKWLFLEPHPDFDGQWMVESFDRHFLFDFKEMVGQYRAISPAGLPEFLDAADDHGYKVAFFEDPTSILRAYEHLNDEPPFDLNSGFDKTIRGFLPFQVHGFNKLKDLDGGVARWDTGTGKTVLAGALAKYHGEVTKSYDLCIFVVKSKNKVNTTRKLRKIAGVDSTYITKGKRNRTKYYERVIENLEAGTPQVMVINYEKFRDDFVDIEKPEKKGQMIKVHLNELGEIFFNSGLRLMIVWDEMPMKLKTRTTALYMSVVRCLYTCAPPQVNWEKKRAPSLRQYMLSATPIENDPEDWFNCFRVVLPYVYGTVTQFRDEYVARYSFFDEHKPEAWHRLDKMGLVAEPYTHEVDKSDPDIAKFFPKQIEETIYVEMPEKMERLYKKLQDLAEDLDDTEDEIPIIALINVLQMFCDAPTMLLNSAAQREIYEGVLEAWEEDMGRPPPPDGSKAALRLLEGLEDKLSNDDHAKFEELHRLLFERHPDEKFCVFASWNDTLMPILIEEAFEAWGVNYVRYHGTDAQAQVAQDAFLNDPDVRVFLSSDAGSDSIDLEAGSVTVNYNLPVKWSTKIQRSNRQHRATSTHDTVWVYNFVTAGTVEERREKIVEQKHQYHQGVFKGAIADASVSARMTKDDLRFILAG